MLKTGKGRPFLEIFALSLNEDYRFPILEVYAFLYTLSTFVFARLGGLGGLGSGEAIAFNLVNSLTVLPVFILVILILKNIAYGVGSDLEKGVIQTLFSYPLKRRLILTAKLLSALGVALLLFLGIQVFSLFILAPDIVVPYMGTVFLTYAAVLSYPLLVAGLVLILTLFLKRGSTSLVFGIVLYFVSGILTSLMTFIAHATRSNLLLKAFAILNPSLVLIQHYLSERALTLEPWAPSFSEVLLYIGGCYAIVASVFIVGYVYFERRLGL